MVILWDSIPTLDDKCTTKMYIVINPLIELINLHAINTDDKNHKEFALFMGWKSRIMIRKSDLTQKDIEDQKLKRSSWEILNKEMIANDENGSIF